MANDDTGNLDPKNEAGDQDPDEDLEPTDGDDVDALKEKNRQLFERAKKAETENKELKAQSKKPASESEPDDKPAGAPRGDQPADKGSDYAEEKYDRLLVRTEGITDSDQIDFVIGAAKRMGVSVEDALKDDFVRGKLESLKKEKESDDAIPKGSKRAPSSSSPKGTVDYWIDRDDLPEDIPANKELRRKISLARAERARGAEGIPPYKQQ